ncbi:MAG: nitroreductase [Dehalococcoidia bacterium]|nr:nitroreductase [Dehalococcoidia bacterium]
MDIVEAIRTRRSARGFKRTPVPRGVITEILRAASHSPSTMNTQPWGITVVAGQVLEDIKRGNIDALNSGVAPQGEVPLRPYEGAYRQRQVDLAIEIFRLMGIAREDKEKRTSWMHRGYRFFDAPAGLILTIDKSLDDSPLSLLDMGAIMQTICLAALDHGLATCIEDQAVMFPQVIRRVTGMSASKRIVIGIAIGYPDADFPANRLETKREPVEAIVDWCGFDERQ